MKKKRSEKIDFFGRDKTLWLCPVLLFGADFGGLIIGERLDRKTERRKMSGKREWREIIISE